VILCFVAIVRLMVGFVAFFGVFSIKWLDVNHFARVFSLEILRFFWQE
jgi:hypothetical protein